MAIQQWVELGEDKTVLLKYFAALFVSWYTISSIIIWHRLRHIPGPFLGKFSHLWSIYHNFAGDMAHAHSNLSRYNSPLVRTGPHYLITADPAVWRHVNGARSIYNRDAWWSAFRLHPQRPSLADTIDMVAHDKLKAKMASGYSGRDFDLEMIVDEQIAKLIDVLRRNHVGRNKVDFAELSRFFTLDVITRLAYGKEFGWVEADKDLYGFCADLSSYAAFKTIMADVQWMHPIMQSSFINSRLRPKPTASHGVGKVLGLGQVEIKTRFAEDNRDERDMMGSFMRHGLSMSEIEDEALNQILAGSETTAIVIRSTLLHLIATPRVWEALTRSTRLLDLRLKTDINKAVSSGNVSNPITLAQAQSLPYFQAVMWEGFRMRPAVTYGQFKVVPPGGDTIAGIWVPGGTAIGHSHFGMMRDKRVFGDDVDLFRPERFLDAPNGCERQKTVELVFGAGRWMCAGKQVAMMELNKVFWELLRHFDFQLADPCQPGWKETSNILFAHSDMWIKISETQHE